jgi:UDP-N-acetylmuramate dehydrogenase
VTHDEALADLQRRLGGRLLRGEPLARFTAARLGGPADWLYIARNGEGDGRPDPTDELVEVVSTAWARGLDVRVLGGGANVLVADSGFRGLVVINHIDEVKTGDWHDGRNLSATAGVSLTHLARRCAALGLAGMEWAVAVPGTVGGGVVNNAGAHGGGMADSVADVVVLEADGVGGRPGVQLYPREALAYAYRSSALKARADRRFVVLLATFCFTPDNPAVIQTRMNEFNTYRRRTQPPGASLGSVFKNPPGDFAGRLIETAGLKGVSLGGVAVSEVHANFFVNVGGAGSAGAYFALIRHVQAVVQEQHGVLLEPEIEFLGEFDHDV